MNIHAVGRLSTVVSSAESGMHFQTFAVDGKSLIRRYSPAPPAFNVCACSVAFSCPDPLMTGAPFLCQYGDNCTAGTISWTVPGMITACTYYELLLGSDLRCFFNKTCIETMLSMYNVDMSRRLSLPEAAFRFVPLNSSVESRFLPTTKIQTLFDEFMLEEWTTLPYYEGHYRACAPPACTYTTVRRLDRLYVVSTIIAFFGGLAVVFRLLVPILVRMGYWMKHHWRHRWCNTNGQRAGPMDRVFRLNVLKESTRRRLKNMDLFRQESSKIRSPNAKTMAILSTRVYAIALPVCICVLASLYGLSQQSISTTVVSPSLTVFEQLDASYHATLSCPCGRLAINFSSFSSTRYTLHQVSGEQGSFDGCIRFVRLRCAQVTSSDRYGQRHCMATENRQMATRNLIDHCSASIFKY